MKVTYKGKELELWFGPATSYVYEKLTEEPFDESKLMNRTVLIDCFYSDIVAALKRNNMPIDMKHDEFLFKWLNENGGQKLLNDYAYDLANQLQIIYDLKIEENKETTEEEEKKMKVKKSKKS